MKGHPLPCRKPTLKLDTAVAGALLPVSGLLYICTGLEVGALSVTFFEYLEEIVLYCYKKNNNLKVF